MTQQWNSSQTAATITLSGSPALTGTDNTGAAGGMFGSESVISSSPPGGNVGYYMEHTIAGTGFSSTTDNAGVGWGNTSALTNNYCGFDDNAIGWFPDGHWYVNNTSIGTGATYNWTSGTILLCLAVDVVHSLIYGRVGTSGNWNGSPTANPATQTGGVSFNIGTITANPMVPGAGLFSTTTPDSIVAAFDQASWQGTPPSGFGPFDITSSTVFSDSGIAHDGSLAVLSDQTTRDESSLIARSANERRRTIWWS